jgi:exonuclease SbcD
MRDAKRSPMNILHTSDWHLGRALYGRKRHEEFQAFLDWLADAIEQHAVDSLLVAGDVFDTPTPGNRAQALYYRFLCRVAASRCRHVVVIAGNHDSPTFLDAPRELLKALHVHVVGQAPEQAGDELIVLADAQGAPELIVCAVPYLRDRDIRQAEAGESPDDKARKLADGIAARYAQVLARAAQTREALGEGVPIVAMGHLFTAGGQTVDGDGVRELYVGSLAHVGVGMFAPEGVAAPDYVALGHLHVPQAVGGNEAIRYCGSPLPMGFGEAAQRKSVCLVDLGAGAPAAVRLVEVPVFQPLERLHGDWPAIERRLHELKAAGSRAWLEVVYTGAELMPDLRERLDAAAQGSALEILRVKNDRVAQRVLARLHDEETLADLGTDEVFERCLAAHEVPEPQRPDLRLAYRETLLALAQHDGKAA